MMDVGAGPSCTFPKLHVLAWVRALTKHGDMLEIQWDCMESPLLRRGKFKTLLELGTRSI